MPLSKQMYGVKGDECQCGRRESVRHCPSCGSTRVNARMNRYHQFVDGTVKLVDNEYRCQACGHLFVDAERMFCEAPPVGQKLASQRVKALHEAGGVTPTERIAAKSLARLMSGTEQKALSEEELAKLKTELRKAYAQHLLAFNAKERTDHPGDVDVYIENGVKTLEAEWLKASQA